VGKTTIEQELLAKKLLPTETRDYTVPMTRAFGFVSVIVVAAVGGYLYMNQMQTATPGGTTPKVMIDVTAVRNDLLAMANAERRYWATNAKYASLDELRNNGDISIPSRANYVYSVDTGDSGFKIVATYSGSDPTAPKNITVDETMAMTTK
jgi:hypothetical protein